MSSAADPSFGVLSKALRSGLGGAADVAAACLRYATVRTNAGYKFDSAAERNLDVRPALVDHIGGHLKSFLHPTDVIAIADAIEASAERPLAAWCAAHLISLAIEQDFYSSVPMRSEHRLKHLQPYPVAVGGCRALYGGSKGLSARPRPERHRNDPSSVGGLALWQKSRARPYEVVVDREGGEQFSRCLDEQRSLKVALLQPNRSLSELCLQSLSAPTEAVHRFFGVRPHDEKSQVEKVTAGLKRAATAGAGIALLPELVMTEPAVARIAQRLAEPGTVIADNADEQTLRVVVSGSFHHLDDGGRRNSVRVHFPRTGSIADRQHSKSGFFAMTAPRIVLEAMTCDHTGAKAPAAAVRADPASHKPIEFREDITQTKEIRLYLGARFSAIVVICADLLDTQLREAVKALAPSIVLVCNMTEKHADFASVAHELITASQTTLIAVNNPAEWFTGPVVGALVGMPLANLNDRIGTAHFPDAEHIVIFDFAGRALHEWP